MTTTRKLIWAFWIFIVIMLLWQFYNYNQGMTQDAIDHPTPEHFFFHHTNSVATPNAPANRPSAGAVVIQSAFTVQRETPGPGSFTCLVTLKNVGTAKALNVQVHVRPYKGVMMGDEELAVKPLPNSDPLSQMGQWVTFPDLAPGQSATQTANFLNDPKAAPGKNPDPEIIYESDKTPTPRPAGAAAQF